MMALYIRVCVHACVHVCVHVCALLRFIIFSLIMTINILTVVFVSGCVLYASHSTRMVITGYLGRTFKLVRCTLDI